MLQRRQCQLQPVPLAGLKKKLKDHMKEFSDLRQKIMDESRQVVQRRVYTVTGQNLPEEEIDRMIETGEDDNDVPQHIAAVHDMNGGMCVW